MMNRDGQMNLINDLNEWFSIDMPNDKFPQDPRPI